jgi:hypothetical protein
MYCATVENTGSIDRPAGGTAAYAYAWTASLGGLICRTSNQSRFQVD